MAVTKRYVPEKHKGKDKLYEPQRFIMFSSKRIIKKISLEKK